MYMYIRIYKRSVFSVNAEKCSLGRSYSNSIRGKTLYSLFPHQGGSSATEQTTTFITVQYENTIQQRDIIGNGNGIGIECGWGVQGLWGYTAQ